MKNGFYLVGLLTLLPLSGAIAATSQFEVDPAATKIEFTLGATLHTVHGNATVGSGTLQVDAANQKISGEIVVPAAQLTTHNDGRDKNMQRDVLESEKFPQITLKLDHYEGNLIPEAVSRVKVFGTMNIHGAEHPLDFPVDVTLAGERWNATGDLQVPFVAWGMKDPSAFVFRVGKEVHVHLNVSGKVHSQ